MAPVKGLSDARILPRLGKIRLGIKVERPGRSPYPQAVDYFVVPDEIKQYLDDKPKELHIMFPSEDQEQITRQYLRRYGQTHGLTCWGDGEKAHTKIDTDTGAMAGRDTKNWEWRDTTCNPTECPEFGAGCKAVMNLMFMLPDVPGLGVWQIDTSSFYSVRSINSSLEIIRNLTRSEKYPQGRISFIPLTLKVGPIEVNPPGTGKKTVYIMSLHAEVKLGEIMRQALLPPGRVLTPEPLLEEAPDDLFPAEVLAEREAEAVDTKMETPPDTGAAWDALGVDKERQVEWEAIRKLMPDLRVNSKTARSYFTNVFDISISPEELDKETVPTALTLHMLREFRQRLEHSRMNLGN